MPLPPLTLSTDVAPATKWNVLQLIDCSALRSIPITGTSSLLWPLLTSHSSLLLRLMRPPVRSPRLRCTLFPLIHLPHLLVLPATFWTSSFLADLSAFPSLICGFCPSGQGFAYSFLQIPPRDGHPCCSAMYFVVAYAYSGLSPVRARPWRANQNRRRRTAAPVYSVYSSCSGLQLFYQCLQLLILCICKEEFIKPCTGKCAFDQILIQPL